VGQEITLTELEEIVGELKAISSNRLFTEVHIGDYVLSMENGTENTKTIAKELKQVKKGSKIGILKHNGGFKLRRCKNE